MAYVGRGSKGTVYTGKLNLPPSFLTIGTYSGLTANGILIANGDLPFTATTPGTSGQLLIGATGSAPAFGNITSSGGTLTFTPGPNSLNMEAGGTVPTTFVTNSGSASPSLNSLNVFGQQAGTIPVIDTIGSGATLSIEDRTWTSKFVVDSSTTVGLRGTYSTIASAIAAASSGDTIFIRPGTYTENLTLKNGVSLVGGVRNGASGERTKIIGKLIDNGVVTSCVIQNLTIETNSDNIVALTASGSYVVLNDCRIDCANNTGINVSSGATVDIRSCQGDLGTTGIGFWTGAGSIVVRWSFFENSGSSLTASTTSGVCAIEYSLMNSCLSTSDVGALTIIDSYIDCSVINTTALTTAGTGVSFAYNSEFISGTASAISIGAGTTLQTSLITVNSSNTNAITGAGTLRSRGIIYSGNSNKNNVTTLTGGSVNGLTQGTAPSAGFIGENLQATGSVGSVTTATATNVASVSLTAGIWDVSAMCTFAGVITGTSFQAGINVTSATMPGSGGINQQSIPTPPTAASDSNVTICPQRVVLASTTTYYLICYATFTAGTLSAQGIITATRVG